ILPLASPGRSAFRVEDVMAAIWEGSIVFGLVEIPVVLRAAEQPTDDVSFTQLDKKNLSPIGYKRYNKKTGREVEWADIVKGYEYEDGRYVLITDEELRDAHPSVTKTVEIQQFVEVSEIDPVFYDKPYYLEPKKRGGKAYTLLRETLEKTGKVGVARVVIRTRQYLGLVAPRGPVLVLQLLRYPHEIREPEDVSQPESGSKPSAAEVRMAEQLVQSMTARWKPEEFHDDYRDEVLSLVREKVKHGKIEKIEEPKENGSGRESKVIDLMDMLKQSVEKRRGAKRAPAARKTPAGRPGARPAAAAAANGKVKRARKPAARGRRSA
ncbi:MAG TPA: Ku protein, partial [Candidatus Polarisedimenticolaceae bacterium]|nr:Ku protein [Candidatus Polarisedimenticolaceae bacterium]